jgi:hypothetical protein
MIPAPGPQKPAPNFVDLGVLGERLAQVLPALDPGLDQVVAMHRGRYRDPVAPRLHELQQAGLPEHVLENDAVGTQEQIALAGLHVLAFRVVEVPQQHLVGQCQRFAQAAAHHLEVFRHGRVDLGRHFGSRFNRDHSPALLILGIAQNR